MSQPAGREAERGVKDDLSQGGTVVVFTETGHGGGGRVWGRGCE